MEGMLCHCQKYLKTEKEQDDCVERWEGEKQEFQMREVVEEMGWNVREMI